MSDFPPADAGPGRTAADEAWGSVPAWRIAKLRIALMEAELRGSDPGDDGADLIHRALMRRFARGRRVHDAIARNFGIFRALGRRSAYRSPNDRKWLAEFLLHYVSYGRLSDRQAQVLRHIAKRWNVPPPVRDGFVDPTPRPVRAESPRPRPLSAMRLARAMAGYETALRTGEVVSLHELLESALKAHGERRGRAGRLLREAAGRALADSGVEEDEDETS
ncbi:MAG TPA: hypothetical protein VK943_02195 [Arenibaculum sp.]|nr:hypothetical protein [Arenibaculum sp.]